MKSHPMFDQIQRVLKNRSIDCWLIYVKKEMRSWILSKLQLEHAHLSRPLFFLFYPNQDPVILFSELDAPSLSALLVLKMQRKTYFTYQEQRASLQSLLQGVNRLAIDYLQEGSLPSLSTIDAGFKEWIDQQGVIAISSSTFSDEILAKVSEEGLAMHRKAAKGLQEILDLAFGWIQTNLRKHPIYEKQVADLICQWMEEKGLMRSLPIVAFGANSANPHYEPGEPGKKLETGDLVLIDLWSKLNKPHSIYADFTQVGYISANQAVPQEVQDVFECVKNGQAATIDELTKRLPSSKLTGADADRFARDSIRAKGYGDYFRHRTGHNVGEECHGLGVNFDSIEFPDPRVILSEAIFTVEPGIYLPGKFGIRLECDLYIDRNHQVEVTGGRQQSLRILTSD